jgi:hypothetical protein
LVNWPAAAEIVTEVDTVTGVVFTMKAAVDCPDATATLVGTTAAGLLLESKYVPAGAPFRISVPVVEVPPFALAELSVM